jgi:hypothetical protein
MNLEMKCSHESINQRIAEHNDVACLEYFFLSGLVHVCVCVCVCARARACGEGIISIMDCK